ncbi:MAG: hypothetical protein EA402_08690 [Planctomycetota bacterium]|nr:MAG: hypothetical protein EA402_08690 [Planctomycetota bacterium]
MPASLGVLLAQKHPLSGIFLLADLEIGAPGDKLCAALRMGPDASDQHAKAAPSPVWPQNSRISDSWQD